MILLGFDAETYYDSEYSLTKMTSEEYIRDPRFELIMVGVAVNDQPTQWFSGTLEEIRNWLLQFPWDDAVCIGHNLAEFDALILVEVLGIRARFWQCTLAIARALGTGKRSYSLAALAEVYGLPPKGTEVVMAKGKRRVDFSPAELAAYGGYCAHDAWLAQQIYRRQAAQLPKPERHVVHWFARMFAEPRLEVDGPLVAIVSQYERDERQRLLMAIADDIGMHDITGAVDYAGLRKMLRSDDRFAALLRSYGVTPGEKLSAKKTATACKKAGVPEGTEGYEVYTYAFAKSDRFMEDLLDDPDPRVASAAEARIGVKSSIQETRLARFAGIAKRGKLPAPFAYGKTHTHRGAGAGKINLQNMGRVKPVDVNTTPGAPVMQGDRLCQLVAFHPDTQTAQIRQVPNREVVTTAAGGVEDLRIAGLRDCIKAPKGKRVVVVDSSAIELRVGHMLAGQMDTIDQIRRGVKIYEAFAEELYGYPVNKKEHPRERNHGKVGMLQLQYQAGWSSFQTQARLMAGVYLTEDEARNTVDIYRTKFHMIKKMWYRCQRLIDNLYSGEEEYIDEYGLCRVAKGRIILPGGLELLYSDLHQQQGEYGTEWVYYDKETRKQKRLYGGVVYENLCQALARLIVFEQSVAIERRWGQNPETGVCLTAHDEAGTVVFEEDAEACLAYMKQEMAKPPAWWPDIPLACEGDIAVRYGTAK